MVVGESGCGQQRRERDEEEDRDQRGESKNEKNEERIKNDKERFFKWSAKKKIE